MEEIMDMKRMEILTDRILPKDEPKDTYHEELRHYSSEPHLVDLYDFSSSDEEEEEEKPKVYNAPPLYIICLVRTLDLVKTTQWKASGRNLLSELENKKMVNHVWASAFRVAKHDVMIDLSIKGFSQLVAGDGLQHLDMREMETDEQDLILAMLTRDSCRNLRTIKFYGCSFFRTNDAIDAVVRLSQNLEELHYPSFLALDLFANCEKMRILKFHRLEVIVEEYFTNEDAKIPDSLKNLEIFGFCSQYNKKASIANIISRILEECPKVVSVGSVDSSAALDLIQQKNSGLPRHFKLRRCFWENECPKITENNDGPTTITEPRQFSVVQTAVALCPLVEELIIKVSDPSCLSHLKQLKYLSVLYVAFLNNSDENILELISLFKVIGPKLKHLCIEGKGEIPVDGIFQYCSNLESLHIRGTMTVTESFETSVGAIRLVQLRITKTDQSSLLSLLSKCRCRYLTEVVLERVTWLDEDALDDILKNKSFSKVEVLMIMHHSLPDDSFRSILEKLKHLKHIGVASDLQYIIMNLRRNLGLEAEAHTFSNYVGYHDFFSKLFNSCRF